MNVRTAKPLLARTHPDRFIGRDAELERLYMRAVSGGERGALYVSGPANSGVSELLRQVYDRLFREQRFVVPFYFALHPNDRTSHAAAARYLYQFLLQAIAFRRQEPRLINASPDICELASFSPLTDVEWVNQMCEVCGNEGPLNDARAFVRTALNSPFRASSKGNFQVCVIVDDLYETGSMVDGKFFSDEIASIAERSGNSLILASRINFPRPNLAIESMAISVLNRSSTGALVETLATNSDVAIADETRDLIAVQFGGRPGLIELFVQAAASKAYPLENYRDVERLYTEELLKGGLGSYFDEILKRAVPDPVMRQKLIAELSLTIAAENAAFPIEVLRDTLGIERERFVHIIDVLTADEVLMVENGHARLADDEVLGDFLASRHRTSATHKAPGAVAALTVTKALKRAPKMMSRIYRRESSLGIAELLLMFDVQDVPRSLIDYRVFRDELKGLNDDEIGARLLTGAESIVLPQISHAAPIVEHLSDFDSATEPQRAVIGVGFLDRGYRDGDEVAWFAAEIDSKLEADLALTEEWCKRLEAAAAELGYSNFNIWLIAPEGFSDAALEILDARNGLGSNRRQVQLFRDFLSGGNTAKNPGTAEYEITIPIGGETELIAAHALEEIARKYQFPPKTVNQIKTALVEACINAAEHSLSPDRKIHQRFTVDDQKIVITVSNRGLRLSDKVPPEPAAQTVEGRRGWGLGLIRGLMDEVRVESVDDGTRIVMTKFLNVPEKKSR
jgi:serine/threonine-protein kinase RsbW